jgi:regulator of protease activity HflC (stomatin/prohibitin superfamily)
MTNNEYQPQNHIERVIHNLMRRFGLKSVLLVAVGLLALSSSFFVVTPSEMAGTRWMGGKVMTATPLGPGVHFKVPFLETVDTIQTSRSQFDLPDLAVFTNDNQRVDIHISVIYQIPQAAVMKLLYGTGRAGNVDIDSIIIPVVRDRALAAFATHNTLHISDERQLIATQMQREVSEALQRLFGINVIDVQLIGIQYSDVFTASVEEAMKAKAAATQAENAVAQKKFEGEQMTTTADAAAKAAVAKATGDAQAVVLASDAQAKAIATVGEALKANPDYVHFYAVQHWNGAYPTVVGGNAMSLLDLNKIGTLGGGQVSGGQESK